MLKDSFLEVIVPVADYGDTEQRTAKHARRPGSINDKSVLLLPSEKSSSVPFIRALVRRMTAESQAKHVFMHNPDWAFFHPRRAAEIAPDIDTLARDCDLMVTGVAYWGGCTLWSCHACVQFEKRGIPTTLIVTDAFENVARRLLKSLGYAEIPLIVTPAPVIYLTESEIEERINGLLGKIAASFSDPPNRAANG